MTCIRDTSIGDLPATLTQSLNCRSSVISENTLRYGNDRIQPLLQTLDEAEKEYRNRLFFKAVEGERIIGSIRACIKDAACFIIRFFVHPFHFYSPSRK